VPPDIEIKAMTEISDFKRFKGIWNKLLARSYVDNPYLTYEWFESWWETLGRRREMLLLVAAKGQDIIGIAPFMKHGSFIPGLRVAGVEFAGVPDADYHDFMILKDREETLREFIRYILETARYPFLRLPEMPEHSPNVEALDRILARESNIRAKKRVMSTCRYVPVDAGLPWEDQFRHVKRKMRGDIKRLLNRFKDIGGLRLTRIEPEEVKDALPHLYRHHVRRLAEKQKQSILRNPAHREFFSVLGKRFAERGWLEFLRLDSENDFVGMHYGFRYKGTSYCYQHGYNQALNRYSPGKMVLYHVIKEAHGSGLRKVDLLRGADSYKAHWTDLSRVNYEYMLFGKDRAAQASYIWFDRVKPWLQRVTRRRPPAARSGGQEERVDT
jgi:CelD/BcsL family acetyltransferase involved in cellulose biosynthesis